MKRTEMVFNFLPISKLIQFSIFNFLFPLLIMLSITTTASAAGRGAFAGDSIGARASILGEAFVAVADDANALRWNPAGLGRLLQPEITSSHINFFTLGDYLDYSGDSKAINEDFLGLAYPNHTASFGISILNLRTPGMLHADEGGAIMDGGVSYTERTITASVGKHFKVKDLGLNVGWNLNRFSINGQSSDSGFGMDTGFLVETPGLWPEFGLMLRGLFLGTTLGENGASIPAKTDAALCFQPWKSLKLAGGLSKTSGDSIIQYSTGIEYDFHYLSPLSFSFFAGYKALGGLENGLLSAEAINKAVGASMRISRYKIDYAYDEHSLMGNTHRVTLGLLQQSPVSLHMNRGRQAFERLDDASAIREFKEVTYLSPGEAEAYYLMALTYERMRKKTEAIRLLEKIQTSDFDYFQEHKLAQLLADIREE